jgi:sorbitol-specific phosphotransferase system component IIBC
MFKAMEQLLKSVGLMQNDVLLPGFIFGVVHVSLVILGFYTGWSINRLLKVVSSGFIAGIVGVVIAHVIADYIAATLDPDLRSAALGIVIGGLIPLICIPLLEKYVTKSEHHIAIGDHEDLKKDLKKKHK